jgi:putative ABC transport system permease protein
MTFLADTLQDVRYTFRQLRRNPFFALTVIATLALALGATAALAGVLRATLLNPLPYAHADELVRVEDHDVRKPRPAEFISVPRAGELADYAPNGQKLFASFGFYYSDDSALTIDGHEPVRVPAVAVSGGFFPTLAARPLLGRTLTAADDVRGANQNLVISRALWQTVLAADPNIIGRAVQLGKQPATVVGVMDSSFAYPANVDLWHPGSIFPRDFSGEAVRGDGSRWIIALARMQPGATIANVQQQAARLAATLAHDHPATDSNWDLAVTPLRESLFGTYRKALELLAVAVGLVLLLAAVNIAGLQLSRNARRQPEFTLRTALGVTRSRLTRQLLTESLVLMLAGALAGTALAAALLKLLSTRLPAALVQAQVPHVDLTVFLLALAAAGLVGVFTAALPAWQSTRGNAARAAHDRGSSAAALPSCRSPCRLSCSASPEPCSRACTSSSTHRSALPRNRWKPSP